MATSGFQINGADLTTTWPDRAYLMDRYPELADTFKQAGLWLWGYNNYGNLGNSAYVRQSSPIQTIAGGTNWKSVSQYGAGDCESQNAIKTDGTLWTWGWNYYGQLGNNAAGAGQMANSPIQTVAGGTNWKQSSSSGYWMAAIKTDGTLWTWGRNDSGQLGDSNPTVHQSSPIQTIAGGTNWKQVACGARHGGGIKTDGTLWLWGENSYGQLGDNTTTQRNSPVQTVSAGTNWKSLSMGRTHTIAIKTDGTLWVWGRGFEGELGDNTINNKSSPVQTVAAGTNWKQASGGFYHTVAIKTDGTLWLWGGNTYGQLGDNTTTSRSSPVQTVAGGTNWKLVAGGMYFNGAIKTDGTLWTWGYNNFGQLGDGVSITGKSSPIQTIAGGTNWKSVGTSYRTIHGIRDDSADPI